MPRANRHFLPNYIWHITHRYHHKSFLLKFARDRRRYLHWLFEAKKRFGLSVLNFMVTVRAMKAGAVEFLTKPFRDQDLLDAIQQALERDRIAREQRGKIEELRSRFDSLTPREREVMGLVVAGLLNKQIAGELGTSETTVKIQRHQVMEKMGAGSLAELVRMADRLKVPTPK
jgi:DNA-binding CsgD family transcriptional regulator